jgi:hypothetical protein
VQKTSKAYLAPASDVDMQRAERAIRRAVLIALVALVIAVPAGYQWLPLVFDFPAELSEKLAFAARTSVFVLLWVLIGVGLVSMGRRVSPDDIGGSAAGPPSERIAIHVAFLQNTLEQAVLAAGLYLALATLVSGAWLSLIVIAVIFFGVGRVLFLRGYAEGVSGRSLGMSLTAMPTLLGYLLVIVLLIMRWV